VGIVPVVVVAFRSATVRRNATFAERKTTRVIRTMLSDEEEGAFKVAGRLKRVNGINIRRLGRRVISAPALYQRWLHAAWQIRNVRGRKTIRGTPDVDRGQHRFVSRRSRVASVGAMFAVRSKLPM
jgi:hypothetical protein